MTCSMSYERDEADVWSELSSRTLDEFWKGYSDNFNTDFCFMRFFFNIRAKQYDLSQVKYT